MSTNDVLRKVLKLAKSQLDNYKHHVDAVPDRITTQKQDRKTRSDIKAV